MEKNTIRITGNGNIVIQDAQNSPVTINTASAQDIVNKLEQLNSTQLAALSQLAAEQTGKLTELFTTLLRGVISQKNVVLGGISNVQTARIGDEIHYHYHYAEQASRLPKSLSAKMPRTAQSKIIGREAELADLHTRLFDNKQVLLVNGLGGIGKTTLAQVYVDSYWNEYKHIVWVNQLSDDVMSDFTHTDGLPECLGITTEGKDTKALFLEIMRELEEVENEPNLLIIDNAAASLNTVYDYLPKQPHWHILVTSRNEIDKFDRKELGFLSEDEAVKLFLTYYRHGNISEVEIRELVRTVDLHTLTVEILAKTAQTQRTDMSKLKNAIKEDLRAGVYVKHSGDKIKNVTSYLCSIFSFSNLSENELWLLKQFACLPPEIISYQLLHELINPAACGKEEVFSETMSLLQTKGWLLHVEPEDSYKMHRIIAVVVKKQNSITVEDVEPLLESLSEKLSYDDTKDNPVDKFPWIPYGRAMIETFENSEDSRMTVIQNDLAIWLKEHGDFLEAKRLLEKGMRTDENNFGPEHERTAIRYSNLAMVLQDLGDFEGAKALLEKAVRSDEKNFGTEHPTTAIRYSNLALVLKDLGDYAGAKALLEKAVRSDEKNFGTEHPTTAIRYSNLALVLQVLGDYTGAKALLEKALRFDEKNFGAEHPTTAIRYSNLALVLKDLGDYAGAKLLLVKTMESMEKNFGPEHPNTAQSYSNLATALQDLGDYAGAKVLLEKAVRSNEKNFGTEHPTTAIRYSNLALVLKDLGDYAGAKVLLEKAVRSAEKNFGLEHPSTARSYSNLAMVLQNLGDYAGAKALLEKAVRSNEKNFGTEHPTTAVSYSNLATVLQNLGDYAGAKTLLEKAVKSAEKHLGAEHPNTAISYSNLAMVLKALGDYGDALKYAEKSLQILQKLLPEGHPYIKGVSGNCEVIRQAMKEGNKQPWNR